MGFFGYSRVHLVVTDANNNILYNKKVWMRNGKILLDELKKIEDLKIREDVHFLYGRGLGSVMGIGGGAATQENAVQFEQYADASFRTQIDMSAQVGTGNLLFINGGEPVWQNQDGRLVGLGAANIAVSSRMGTIELKLGVRQTSDMPSNARQAYEQGRQLLSCSSNSNVSQESENGVYRDFYSLQTRMSIFGRAIGTALQGIGNGIASTTRYIFGSFHLLPRHLALSSELELARRQRVLEQSAQRRVEKMLLFDGAALSYSPNAAGFEIPKDFTAPDNFIHGAPAQPENYPNSGFETPNNYGDALNFGAPALQVPGFSIFGDAPSNPGFDDSSSSSGGERMRSGSKAQNKTQQTNGNPFAIFTSSKTSNPNPSNRVSNANAGSKVSNVAANSAKAAVFIPLKAQTPVSTKTIAKENTRAKATNALLNFKTQVPMSEAKTRAQQPLQTQKTNVQMIAKHQANVRVQSARAELSRQMQTTVQISKAMQSNSQVSAQQIQTENSQQTIQMQEASHQISNTHAETKQQSLEQIPSAQTQEQNSNAQTEQQIQIAEIAQPHAERHIQTSETAHAQTPQAALSQRRAKKTSKAKVVARQPIIISANGDEGNKKESPMNAGKEKNAQPPAEEKEKNSAQIVSPIPLAPRRIIPQAVAFLPLRSLFERKGKTKEKARCASKVCGWCGRKAA